MVSRIKDCVQNHKENKAKNNDRIIIPADRFDEYWNDKIILERDLQKYINVSHLYDGIKRRVINDYCYSVINYLQHMYGSPLPIAGYNINHYKILLKIYEKHKNEYNLEFPSFPKEHLFKPIIPDN
jgi:hypothetical protein